MGRSRLSGGPAAGDAAIAKSAIQMRVSSYLMIFGLECMDVGLRLLFLAAV
jgi:hypothetical protein